ncbi:aromatase/cyclase [Actinocrispum wychmicini]|uniref:Aromatase n=1 Tax=Actinocrispum wychmicini TaxID=1213861 RepID=A0A4R2JXH0_9PSEU|nr:SRPBCC family protein [Actinocrispum wychmicini]TCO62046.1 aromatase [Actinocrispum wychmicini]
MPETVHTAVVAASASKVYDLVADISQAVRFFGNVVHTALLESTRDGDRVRRWIVDGDTIRVSEVARELDPAAGRIGFRHETPPPGLAAVSGEWSFKASSDDRTEVRLRHEFTPAGEPPGAQQMLSDGAERQLAQLVKVAEQRQQLIDLEVFYEAQLLIDGDLDDVFDYFYRTDRWPETIPHCLSVDTREDQTGLQIVEMQVRVPSGAVHTTKQARVCLPGDRIVWRQMGGLPPLDQALYGYTSFTQTNDGVLARAGQTELLKPEAVAKRGWDVQQAKDHVAEVRGERNLGALRSAQEFLNRRRDLVT